MLGIIIGLVVVGILLYCINKFIPMDEKIKKILNVVVIIGIIIWILNVVGIIDYLKRIPAPHVSLQQPIEMIG